jgi:hypothetical protein
MPNSPVSQDDFDEAWYLDRYPDINEAVKRGAIPSGYRHFVEFGQQEGRAYRICVNNSPSTLGLRHPAFRHRFYRCVESGRVPAMDTGMSVDHYLAEYFSKMELVRE